MFPVTRICDSFGARSAKTGCGSYLPFLFLLPDFAPIPNKECIPDRLCIVRFSRRTKHAFRPQRPLACFLLVLISTPLHPGGSGVVLLGALSMRLFIDFGSFSFKPLLYTSTYIYNSPVLAQKLQWCTPSLTVAFCSVL